MCEKYICDDCGQVFDAEEMKSVAEVHTELEFNPVEYRSGGCPNCGSEYYNEAEQCKECGEWFIPHDLKEGLCEGCLQDAITYDAFEAFAKESDKFPDVPWVIEDFMFQEVFGISLEGEPRMSSITFKEYLWKQFKLLRMEDEAILRNGKFLQSVKDFVKRNYPDEFAEFVTEERG